MALHAPVGQHDDTGTCSCPAFLHCVHMVEACTRYSDGMDQYVVTFSPASLASLYAATGEEVEVASFKGLFANDRESNMLRGEAG